MMSMLYVAAPRHTNKTNEWEKIGFHGGKKRIKRMKPDLLLFMLPLCGTVVDGNGSGDASDAIKLNRMRKSIPLRSRKMRILFLAQTTTLSSSCHMALFTAENFIIWKYRLSSTTNSLFPFFFIVRRCQGSLVSALATIQIMAIRISIISCGRC